MEAVILVVLLLGLLGVLVLMRALFQFRDFKYQLDYINREIARSSPGEVRYWKKQRRKLWRRFLLHPF